MDSGFLIKKPTIKLNAHNYHAWANYVLKSIESNSNLTNCILLDKDQFRIQAPDTCYTQRERNKQLYVEQYKIEEQLSSLTSALKCLKEKYKLESYNAMDWEQHPEEMKLIFGFEEQVEWELRSTANPNASSAVKQNLKSRFEEAKGKGNLSTPGKNTLDNLQRILDIQKQKQDAEAELASVRALAEEEMKRYTYLQSVVQDAHTDFYRHAKSLLNQFVHEGENGLIDPEYLKILKSDTASWRDMMAFVTSSCLKETWDHLKFQYKRSGQYHKFNGLYDLMSMVPLPAEKLIDFELRFDELVKSVLEDITPDMKTSRAAEEMCIHAYALKLKKFYKNPFMSRFLGPYFAQNADSSKKTYPATYQQFCTDLRCARTQHFIQSATGDDMAAVQTKGDNHAVLNAAVTNVQNKSQNSRSRPNGKSQRNPNRGSRSNSSESDPKPAVSSGVPPKTPPPKSSDNSIKPKPKGKNAKKKKVILSSHEVEYDDEDDFEVLNSLEEVVVLTAAEYATPTDVVQLDNGANRHIFNNLRLFKTPPTDLNSDVRITGVFRNAPLHVTKEGETYGFGRAYYDPLARNLLSQSSLEYDGFRTTPLKLNRQRPHMITAWEVSSNDTTVTFELRNGIFQAPLTDVLNLGKHYVMSAMSTRGNPLGLPNTSIFPTGYTRSMIEPPPFASDISNPEFPMPTDTSLNQSTLAISPTQSRTYVPDVRVNDSDVPMYASSDVPMYATSDVPTYPPVPTYADTSDVRTSAPASSPDVLMYKVSDGSSIEATVSNTDQPESTTTLDPNAGIAPPLATSSSDPAMLAKSLPDMRRQMLVPVADSNDPRYAPSLGRLLTSTEQRKLDKVHDLHLALNHAGRATEKSVVEGHLLNCELTCRDIDLYYEMRPTCLGCVKGKMRMPPTTAFTPRTGAFLGEYWELDIAYFGGKTYAVFIEILSKYCCIYPLLSRKEGSLRKVALDWHNVLAKHFPRAIKNGSIHLRCDREPGFHIIQTSLPEVELNRTSAEGHANRAEVLIKIIKERARATLYALPYQLPQSRYADLIAHIIETKNYTPGTLTSLETPHEMVTGRKLDANTLMRAQFGQTGCVIIPTSQRNSKDQAVAQEGICVGFEPGNPNNLQIYIPSTGRTVHRAAFKPLPPSEMPHLISLLNQQAAQQGSSIELFEEQMTQGVETYIEDESLASSTILSSYTTDIDDANMTIKAAIAKYGEPIVREAAIKEVANMENMNVFSFIDPSSLKKTTKILPSKDFLKAKYSDGRFVKLKARIVVRGDLQTPDSFDNTKSPTADKSSLFLIAALNKYIKGTIYSCDVPAAFLFAPLSENIYMTLTKDMTDIILESRPELRPLLNKNGKLVAKLEKSIYGLKQAPRNWYDHLMRVITRCGFKGCIADRCVLQFRDKRGITNLLFHVDDFFISSNCLAHIAALKKQFYNAFGEMQWSEREFTFLGMHFKTRDDHSIDIDMTAYTVDIIDKHWKPEFADEFKIRRGLISPSNADLFNELAADSDEPDASTVKACKSIAMELLYLSSIRIDILKECVCIAMTSHRPSAMTWRLIRRVINYLKVNPSYVVNLGTTSTQLTVYCDAGYAEHIDARSHTGIYVTLGDNAGPILVKSKKQGLVTQSSTEAELLALTDAVKRSMVVAKILVELGFNDHVRMYVRQDNMSTITIAKNGEGLAGKAKHFRVRFHYLRELIEENQLVIEYCNTNDMIADYLTKPMVGLKFYHQVLRAMYHSDTEVFKTACEEAFQRVINNKSNVN